MKKKFKKKGGFTLVEIVVAFAVFSIMAVMICQILNLTIERRKSNDKFEAEIAEQEKNLIAKGKTYDYDTTHGIDGTLSLKFNELSDPMTVNYQLRNADGTVGATDGINYFVGQIDYAANGESFEITPPGGDISGGNPTAGPQSSRFDTRIAGMKGFNYIEIKSVTKITPQKYKISVCADSSTMQADNLDYAQFTLFIGKKSEGIEITKLLVDDDAGFSVRRSGDNGVRVGVKPKGDHSAANKHMTPSAVATFTVELNKVPSEEITKKSFGGHDDGKYTKFSQNIANSDGTSQTVTYDNIYGAYTSTPDPAPVTSDETGEPTT